MRTIDVLEVGDAPFMHLAHLQDEAVVQGYLFPQYLEPSIFQLALGSTNLLADQ